MEGRYRSARPINGDTDFARWGDSRLSEVSQLTYKFLLRVNVGARSSLAACDWAEQLKGRSPDFCNGLSCNFGDFQVVLSLSPNAILSQVALRLIVLRVHFGGISH
jgi:hypothetical protein